MQSKLKIDLDWLPPYEWLLSYRDMIITILDPFVIVSKIEYKLSPGEKGYHVIIDLGEEINDMMALKLQFLLGDDRTRCRLNFARIKGGVEGWNKLWSYKIKRD